MPQPNVRIPIKAGFTMFHFLGDGEGVEPTIVPTPPTYEAAQAIALDVFKGLITSSTGVKGSAELQDPPHVRLFGLLESSPSSSNTKPMSASTHVRSQIRPQDWASVVPHLYSHIGILVPRTSNNGSERLDPQLGNEPRDLEYGDLRQARQGLEDRRTTLETLKEAMYWFVVLGVILLCIWGVMSFVLGILEKMPIQLVIGLFIVIFLASFSYMCAST